MKRATGLLLSLFVLLLPAVGHAKGGWALASFEPLPPVVAGEDAPIAFTLLQHGVTPVDAAEWGDVDLQLAVRGEGGQWSVDAEPVGAPGRYVAIVEVPTQVETLSFNVEWPGGLLIPEQWIDVAVTGGAGSSSSEAGSDGWVPDWTVPLLALVAIGCAAVVVLDVRRGRAVA